MRRFSEWHNSFSLMGKTLLSAGSAIFLFGLMVLVFPQILIALIATFFMGTGATLIISALRSRESKQYSYEFVEENKQGPFRKYEDFFRGRF